MNIKINKLVCYVACGASILISACQVTDTQSTQKLPERFELKSADWSSIDSGDQVGGVAYVTHIENNLYDVNIVVDEAKSKASYFSKDKTLLGRFAACTQVYIAGSLGMKYSSLGLASGQSAEFTNPYNFKVLVSPSVQLKIDGEAIKYTWEDVREPRDEKYTMLDYCKQMFERFPLKK